MNLQGDNAAPCLIGRKRRHVRSGPPAPSPSMQSRRLEKSVAIRRSDLLLKRMPVAIQLNGNFDSGPAERPDLAEHAGETADVLAPDGPYDIAGAQSGTLCGAAVGEPDDHDPIVDLGRIEAEPGARRPVGPAAAQRINDDRLEVPRPPHHRA